MTTHPKSISRRTRFVNSQERRERQYPVLTRIDSGVSTLILFALVLSLGFVTYQVVSTPENLENLRTMARSAGLQI